MRAARVHSAATSLESRPQEARAASCGAAKTALSACCRTRRVEQILHLESVLGALLALQVLVDARVNGAARLGLCSRPLRRLRGFRGLCRLRRLCGLRNRGLRLCLLLLQLRRDLLRRVQGTGCRRGCSRRVHQAEEAEGSMRIASGLHALHELLHEVAHAPAQQHQGLLLGCAPCGRAPPVQLSHEAAVGDRLQPLAHD